MTKANLTRILKQNGYTGGATQLTKSRPDLGTRGELRVLFCSEKRGYASVFLDARHPVTGVKFSRRMGEPLQTFNYTELLERMGFGA